jgi:thiamine biosynthesis lipoprotein
MTNTLFDPDRGLAAIECAVATRTLRAIGTTAVVAVTDPATADRALAMLDDDLAALDDACSRFRPDSELSRIERTAGGRPVVVSSLLFEALEVACAVAVRTAGIVDPTIGAALVELGYDRDFDELRTDGTGTIPSVTGRAMPVHRPAPGWWRIELDPERHTVAIPEGIHVDLGSTAKAMAADRSARRIADELGGGVLVSLGGDVAVAGSAPAGGWAVGIATECTAGADEVDQVVALHRGGLATSGTTARTWRVGGRRMHHIVDPWTGQPAAPVWSLVSTTAPSCIEANAWSTAAVVWGDDAPGNLAAHGVPARLVRADGAVTMIGDWPHDPPAATAAVHDLGRDRKVA